METKLFKSAICRVNNIFRPYPTLFYFPGIKSQQVWDSNLIPTAKLLEKNSNTIAKEIINLDNFENDYKLIDKEKSLHEGSWDWASYMSKGKVSPKFKEKFPNTYEILNSLDDLMFDVPFSYCFFSRLAPKSKIKPHYGPCNLRLRIHLGLDIPDNCFMKITDIKHNWEDYKTIVFDDTYIHEVENNNENKYRTLLLLDIWHPEIKKEEREAIRNMFKGASSKGWIS